VTGKSITKFKNLSNEILFDTFKYLYRDEFVHAFNGLNYRLDSILKDYRLLSNLVFSRVADIQSVIDSTQIQNVYLRASSASILSTSSSHHCSSMPQARRHT
jgi:hypothetical protein